MEEVSIVTDLEEVSNTDLEEFSRSGPRELSTTGPEVISLESSTGVIVDIVVDSHQLSSLLSILLLFPFVSSPSSFLVISRSRVI